MKEPLETLLGSLQLKLVQNLLRRMEDGSATAADLAVARQLLKDNNKVIDAANPARAPLRKLGNLMPFQDPDTPIAANQ